MSTTTLLHGGTTPLAALTTIFTPPPNCATSTWLLTTTEAPSQYPPFPTEGPSSCNIPRWEDNIDEGSYDFYSPAICPSGFVVGPSCTSVQVKTSDDFPKVEAGETVAFCVPSGYSCTADTTEGGVWGMTQTEVFAAQVTVAPAIQIRWRDFDLTLFPTHPLSPGVTIGIGPKPTRATPSSPPPGPTGPAGGNGVIVVPLPTVPRSTVLTSTTGKSDATALPIPNPNSASQPRIPDDQAASPATTTRLNSSTATTAASTGRSSQSADLTKASPMESTNSHGLPLGPIILACLISVLIFSASVFFFSKRRRDRGGSGSGTQPPLLPVGVGVWVGSSHEGDSKRKMGSIPTMWTKWIMALRKKSNRQVGDGWPNHDIASDAQKQKSRSRDTMGWAGCPAEGAPGSKENPAELEQLGNGHDSEAQQRWSWVSRMFSIRASRQGEQDDDDDDDDDDYFKSSVMSSRRTTRSSRWTVSDAEAMTGDRQHDLTAPGALWPPVPAVPRLPRPLPAVLISSPKSPTLTLRPMTARSAFTVRTETTEMSDISEENDMLSRLSLTRISCYTGAGGLLSPRSSSRRLSHISGGTFGPGGGGGSSSSRNSHSRSSRATPES
ncbi:uncharacterized protein PpBr36_10889 [Pyricularia pennisetigena]|uniref:uncharacterized protein n=1 Tax=Pyricularia pennisetigena TaxID=1578925 RepID=UPI0011521E43|nr:uncharacterized protein PpBr36_10889 [Pyricularia pennisetigena]TLS20971.1 hypothetical protein PpBr36_10889 [Pyricularia pennisetigena]